MARKVEVVKTVNVTSDIDGADGADYRVLVREHPVITKAKLLDVTAQQAKELQGRAITDVLRIELKHPDGSKEDLFITQADFDKWLRDPKAILSAASNAQGRPKGYSPGNGE